MEVKKSLFQIKSSNGKNNIQCYEYTPTESKNIKGILQILHGMSEYFLRYEEFALFMSKQGFVVCGNDHLGHGNSVASEDEYGYFAEENGWQYLDDDVYKVTCHMKHKYHKLPYFLLGHSMGSFILRQYLTEHSYEVDGAIIVGTSGSNSNLPAALALCNITISLQGSKYRSNLLDKLTFGSNNSRFKPSRTKFDWLSRDKEIVDKYVADPKCGFIFTAAGFRDLFTILKKISSKEWAKSINIDLPILMLSGEKDCIGGYCKGVTEVYEALKKAGVNDVCLKLYQNARHEVLNEVNRSEVFSDIYNWLSKHL